MSPNKVVIKVNLGKELPNKPLIEPELIKAWDIKKIITFISILFFLVLLIFISLRVTQHNSEKELENNTAQTNENLNLPSDSITVANNQTNNANSPISTQNNIEFKTPTAIIFDKRIVSTALSGKYKNTANLTDIKSPINLTARDRLDIFYYNEVIDLKNQTLYFNWFKNGEIVFKKTLHIKLENTKIFSRRRMTNKDFGLWQIQLVDGKGKVFNEINFIVN